MINNNKPVFGANEPLMTGEKIYNSNPYRGDALPESRKQEISSFIKYWNSLTREEQQELVAQKGRK